MDDEGKRGAGDGDGDGDTRTVGKPDSLHSATPAHPTAIGYISEITQATSGGHGSPGGAHLPRLVQLTPLRTLPLSFAYAQHYEEEIPPPLQTEHLGGSRSISSKRRMLAMALMC